MAVSKARKERTLEYMNTIEAENGGRHYDILDALMADGWKYIDCSSRSVLRKRDLVAKIEAIHSDLDQNRREWVALICREAPRGMPLDDNYTLPSGRCVKMVAPKPVCLTKNCRIIVQTYLKKPHWDFDCKEGGECEECRVHMSNEDETEMREKVSSDSHPNNYWATATEIRLFDLGYSNDDPFE